MGMVGCLVSVCPVVRVTVVAHRKVRARKVALAVFGKLQNQHLLEQSLLMEG